MFIGLGLGTAPQGTMGGNAPSYGPELWPQVEFDASAGVTLDAGGGTMPTISGGVLTFPNDGDPASATATALDTIAIGTYRYEMTINSIDAGAVNISIADDAGGDIEGAGDHAGNFAVIAVGSQTIVLSTSFIAAVVTRFSLKRVL